MLVGRCATGSGESAIERLQYCIDAYGHHIEHVLLGKNDKLTIFYYLERPCVMGR